MLSPIESFAIDDLIVQLLMAVCLKFEITTNSQALTQAKELESASLVSGQLIMEIGQIVMNFK